MKYIKKFEDNKYSMYDIIILLDLEYDQKNKGYKVGNMYNIINKVKFCFDDNKYYIYEIIDGSSSSDTTLWVDSDQIRKATEEEIAAKRYNL